MNFFDKLSKIPDVFKSKLTKITSKTNQIGTVELFFENYDNMLVFSKTINKTDGVIFNILNDYSIKNSKEPCFFDLAVSAEPNKNAYWTLIVNPASLKISVARVLNKEFKKIMKVSMSERQKIAYIGIKKGFGNGTINICSISLSGTKI